MTPFLWQKAKEELKRRVKQNEDHGIQYHHFMANRWGNNGNSDTLLADAFGLYVLTVLQKRFQSVALASVAPRSP